MQNNLKLGNKIIWLQLTLDAYLSAFYNTIWKLRNKILEKEIKKT